MNISSLPILRRKKVSRFVRETKLTNANSKRHQTCSALAMQVSRKDIFVQLSLFKRASIVQTLIRFYSSNSEQIHENICFTKFVFFFNVKKKYTKLNFLNKQRIKIVHVITRLKLQMIRLFLDVRKF